MNIKIRLANIKDAEEILNIYKPYIINTVITFEYEVPTFNEFELRMNKIQNKYPWLVCEIDNKIVGYAYASQFHERVAYDWSVDFSIYIKPEYQGKKVGKGLYHALLETLKLQGFCNAYALITSPNTKSENIHKSLGFREMGTCKNVGYKMNKWLDVKWFELEFAKHDEIPSIPKDINDIKETQQFKKIIEDAEKLILNFNNI